MDQTGAGTAIMFAIAAALWFAYFVPTWVRRREYLDTERTATRLQQTLRVMAETAELPEPIRVEVSSRDAMQQQRLLQAQRRTVQGSPAAAGDGAALARRRRRRARRAASLLMVVATVTIVVQLVLVITEGAVLGSWLVLAGGAVLEVASVVVRPRADKRSAPRVAARPRVEMPRVEVDATAPARNASWTPVPIPRPLYLSRPEVQPVHPSLDLAAQLREASLISERAVRAAYEAQEVVQLRPMRPASAETIATRPDGVAAPSRWAAMGRFDEEAAAAPDLDEVLRRRRSAS